MMKEAAGGSGSVGYRAIWIRSSRRQPMPLFFRSRVATSMIQRRFSIGYNRAGRLMDQMEAAGIVGAAQGSKPREVLIQDENQLNNLLMALRKLVKIKG